MRGALLALLLAPAAASAQALPPRPVSVDDGATLGAGRAAAYADVGWPDVRLGYLQGLGDALDVAGDLSLDFRTRTVSGQVWARYGLLGSRDLGFAARLRAEVFVGAFPGGPSGWGVEAAPGLSIGVPVAPDTLFTVLAELPLRLGISGRPTYAAVGFGLGLDHLFVDAGITVGAFVQAAPTLDAPRLLNLAIGARVAVPL